MKQRRLTIIIPDLRGGGAERVVVNIANYLIIRNYKVDLILLLEKGEFLNDLHKDVNIVNLNVKRLKNSCIPLLKYFINNKPDNILVNMWPLTIITIMAKILTFSRARIFVVEHTTWSKDNLTKNYFGKLKIQLSMHYFYKLAQGVITVSKGAADDLSKFANIKKDKITTIYNPITGNEKKSNNKILEPIEWWVGDHKKIISVGSLSPIKNYKSLINAFSELKKIINVRLLILGEGICRNELETQIKKLELDKDIFIPGFVKDLAPYYKQANLFVLSSQAEGFGNVIVEALAQGTPVVSTNCESGPSEILCEGKYGYLVPICNDSKLTRAMFDSLSSNHDFTQLKLRSLEFSIDKAVKKYENLIFDDKNEIKIK
jgi:glycosyltransferase involved in cell wall biosynthesis